MSHILLGIALIILLFYFAVYVTYAVNLIEFPYDYDQGEGFELVDVLMLSRGHWPYADIESYPFYGSIYPPLYHILLVPFAWVFGIEYWYGRLFSFLTTLVTACTIGYAVYREGGRNAIGRNRIAQFFGLTSGLVFLSSPIVYHIGPLFRQHISMVMFETLAVVILANACEMRLQKKRRRQLLLGFGLLIAAGYTKQLAAFTAIAALAFLFIRNPRRGIIWATGFALVGSIIFVGLIITTDGHWWTQTILANVKDYFPHQAQALLRLFINIHFWLLIPSVLMVVYELYFARLSLYSIWFVGVTILNANASGTWGAGDSYYATSIAAMSILSGIFATKIFHQNWSFNRNYLSQRLILPLKPFAAQISIIATFAIGLFYIGYARDTLHMPTRGLLFEQIADMFGIHDNTGFDFHDPDGYLTLGYAQIGHLTTDSDIKGGDHIVHLIEEIPPEIPILSEEAAFSLRTGRDVITNPVVLMILSWADAFDSSALVSMVEDQKFGLIILRAQFYPADVLEAINKNYESDEEISLNGFDYIIMRPA